MLAKLRLLFLSKLKKQRACKFKLKINEKCLCPTDLVKLGTKIDKNLNCYQQIDNGG